MDGTADNLDYDENLGMDVTHTVEEECFFDAYLCIGRSERGLGLLAACQEEEGKGRCGSGLSESAGGSLLDPLEDIAEDMMEVWRECAVGKWKEDRELLDAVLLAFEGEHDSLPDGDFVVGVLESMPGDYVGTIETEEDLFQVQESVVKMRKVIREFEVT